MNYRDTQKGKIVEQIKEALLAGYPVIHIPTPNKEVINDIIFNDEESYSSFVPRLYLNRNRKLQYHEMGAKVEISKDTLCGFHVITGDENILNVKTPMIFIQYIDSFSKKGGLDMVKSFIALYYDTKEVVKYEARERSNSSGEERLLDCTNYVRQNIRKSLFIIVTPTYDRLPDVIAPYTRVINMPVLSDEEIQFLIESKLSGADISPDKLIQESELFNKLKVSFRGFSTLMIKQLMNLMIGNGCIDNQRIDKDEVIRIINDAKKQMLSNTQGLKWENTEGSDAAGMEQAEKWLREKAELFKDPSKARDRNLEIPKAAIITGVPGSGKSLMAKMAARIFDAPLISLDMGAIRDKYQGESEHNMMAALRMATQLSPCVLWVDEIEKSFSSADGEDSLGTRLFGKFLTWMQEKSAACFVFATSNDVTKLPPELFRSERFDRKFFAFMPTAKECAQIFVANLSKQQADYKKMRKRLPRVERNNCPELLFSEELLEHDTWLNILKYNRADELNRSRLTQEIETDDDGVKSRQWQNRPSNKLFTGADIATIVKEAKFRVSQKEGDLSGQSAVYHKDVFLEAIKSVITDVRPYGQTNLQDIAKCYYLLYINQFESASGNSIVDFRDFNEDVLVYTGNDNNLNHIYDRILFNTIVGAINKYLPQIIERQKIRI